MDTLSPSARSKRMSLVRCKDTQPEMLVRCLVHRLGFRFRLHVRSLPGSPDIVLAKYRKVIFVHGCFWHRHSASTCTKGRLPKSRQDFWELKLNGNRKRDRKNQRALRRDGWRVLTIWECQLGQPANLERKLLRFLGTRPRDVQNPGEKL